MLPATPPNPPFSLTTHTTATSIYNATYPFLSASTSTEVNTHIVLSHILKLHSFENPSSSTTRAGASPPPNFPESLWIASWNTDTRALELVVAVTNGQLGPHPIFIVPASYVQPISQSGLRQRMSAIAAELSDHVPAERVHSVFGPTCLTQAFCHAWASEVPGTTVDEQPYVCAAHKQITSGVPRLVPAPIAGTQIRRATRADEETVSRMCQEYSKTSHVALNMADARQEAASLINARALYVYETQQNGIVAIAAVGRKSEGVACITKLYTSPQHQRRGYGTRLLHAITSQLFSEGKTTITTYLPTDNRGAGKLLRRVGFSDVERGPKDWLEVGFQDTQAVHW